jgi:nickel/cobalt exporter
MLRAAVALLLLGAAVSPAAAHPHIFIDATLRVAFDPEGRLSQLHQSWTFDSVHSTWAIQGLDTNNDTVLTEAELQPLADDYAGGLSDVEFYSYVQNGGSKVAFVLSGTPSMSFDDDRIRLSFDLVPAATPTPGGRWNFAIADQEYYSEILFPDLMAISLQAAPAGCVVEMVPPVDMDSAMLERLYALPPEVTELPEDLAAAVRGSQGAILLTCP